MSQQNKRSNRKVHNDLSTRHSPPESSMLPRVTKNTSHVQHCQLLIICRGLTLIFPPYMLLCAFPLKNVLLPFFLFQMYCNCPVVLCAVVFGITNDWPDHASVTGHQETGSLLPYCRTSACAHTGPSAEILASFIAP